MAKKKFKPNAFNTVTTFSKLLAFVMFVSFPFIGFYLGLKFQQELDKPFIQEPVSETPLILPTKTPLGGVACTMDAKLCPDGSYVGRSGPNCEFAKCK